MKILKQAYNNENGEVLLSQEGAYYYIYIGSVETARIKTGPYQNLSDALEAFSNYCDE